MASLKNPYVFNCYFDFKIGSSVVVLLFLSASHHDFHHKIRLRFHKLCAGILYIEKYYKTVFLSVLSIAIHR